MAEDVEAFIAEKSIEQPVLIGHSMFVAALESNSDVSADTLSHQGCQSCHDFGSAQSSFHLCPDTR
jgi:hypothetical protein